MDYGVHEGPICSIREPFIGFHLVDPVCLATSTSSSFQSKYPNNKPKFHLGLYMCQVSQIKLTNSVQSRDNLVKFFLISE